jgi:hypothetical protein
MKKIVLTLISVSVIFIGFQNFSTAQLSDTAVTAPNGTRPEQFDVRGGMLRAYTRNIKIDLSLCEGGKLKIRYSPVASYPNSFDCNLKYDKRFFYSGTPVNTYLGKQNVMSDSDLVVSVGLSFEGDKIIISFTAPLDLAKWRGPESSQLLAEAEKVVYQRFASLANKYRYIRVVGTIEDSATLATLTNSR